jgi:hypothetical protein
MPKVTRDAELAALLEEVRTLKQDLDVLRRNPVLGEAVAAALAHARQVARGIAELPPEYAVLVRPAGGLPPDYAVLVRPPGELPPDYAVLVRPAPDQGGVDPAAVRGATARAAAKKKAAKKPAAKKPASAKRTRR